MAKFDCIYPHFRFGQRFCISFYGTWWVSDRSRVSLSASWSTFDRKTHMFCRHFLVQVDSLVCSMSGRFWAPNQCFCVAFATFPGPTKTCHTWGLSYLYVLGPDMFSHRFLLKPFSFSAYPRLIKSDAKQSSAKQCRTTQFQAIHGTNQCELQRKATQSQAMQSNKAVESKAMASIAK